MMTFFARRIARAAMALAEARSLVALIYFCLCYPLSWYAKKLEGRLNVAG